MKTIALAVLLLAVPALAFPAYWTGRADQGVSMSGKLIVRCEYQIGGQYFWKTFHGGLCPNTVEVE